MPTVQRAEPEDLLDEAMDASPEEASDNDERVAGVSAWLVSIVLHGVVLLLLLLVVVISDVRTDKAPVRPAVIEPPPELEDPPRERDVMEEVTVEIEADVPVEEPVITDLEIPVEEIQTEDEQISEVSEAKGREEAVSTSETGGSAAFMAIGAGGGSSGAFGNRNGGGRKMAVGRFGGNRASESAVEAALRWFARHQSPNGQWDVDGYPANCTLAGPKCEPGTAHTDIQGDVACTGYALLCFLGAGYDHKTPNKWRNVVRNGIDWLLATQQEDGLIGVRNYEHPIAVMALAEAYAMTNDPSLRDPVQRGVGIIRQRQVRDADGYGLAWDYIQPHGKNDSSVAGWNIMALKSAKAGGLDVGDSMEGAKRWLEIVWKLVNKDWQTLDIYGRSKFPYAWWSAAEGNWAGRADRPVGFINQPSGRESIGLLCAVFLGKRSGDVLLETLANTVVESQLPERMPTDTYYLYYNTLGIFQVGGERWQRWNGVVRDLLVTSQRKGDDCFDGSWDPGLHNGGHSIDSVGRLLVTAYLCLSLEVYYRYLPVAAQR